MAKRELEFTTRLTREDVAGLIEALTEGLKDGLLKVQKCDDVLELAVPRVVDLKIEAEIDEERAEFEIEVSWLTNRAGSPDTVPEENPAGAEKESACAGPSRARSKARTKAGVKAGNKAPVKKSATMPAAARKTAARKSSSLPESATTASAKKTSPRKKPAAKKSTDPGKDSA